MRNMRDVGACLYFVYDSTNGKLRTHAYHLANVFYKWPARTRMRQCEAKAIEVAFNLR